MGFLFKETQALTVFHKTMQPDPEDIAARLPQGAPDSSTPAAGGAELACADGQASGSSEAVAQAQTGEPEPMPETPAKGKARRVMSPAAAFNPASCDASKMIVPMGGKRKSTNAQLQDRD